MYGRRSLNPIELGELLKFIESHTGGSKRTQERGMALVLERLRLLQDRVEKTAGWQAGRYGNGARLWGRPACGIPVAYHNFPPPSIGQFIFSF